MVVAELDARYSRKPRYLSAHNKHLLCYRKYVYSEVYLRIPLALPLLNGTPLAAIAMFIHSFQPADIQLIFSHIILLKQSESDGLLVN